MSEKDLLTYEELRGLLQEGEALVGAGETHGILCGYRCASPAGETSTWVNQVLGEGGGTSALRSALERLQQETLTELTNPDLGFRLLLPADTDTLVERVVELGRWCQGFSYGIGLGGLRDVVGLSSESREFLMDLSEIAQVGLEQEDMERTDQSDEALMELSEYVRMGVLLLHDELQPVEPGPTPDALH